MVLWESSENKVDKIFDFFLKIRPPRENPRSAPAYQIRVVSQPYSIIFNCVPFFASVYAPNFQFIGCSAAQTFK